MSGRERLRRRQEHSLARDLTTTPQTLRRTLYLLETGRTDRLEPEGLTQIARALTTAGDFPAAGFLLEVHKPRRRSPPPPGARL